ncbi:methyltransferase domain-containing protein [Colletotrichum navitas]|uniref:Methyltransferase domain-containing protein n=1 Tax=Colletotrichum navitas TaxID=681940 RepID=A0AAD8Q113_9PEZI|nr:methyltransferase domain-containing protein [Colletotrichum navitas]KAK1593753.1 methyltransferase domain-containing protein [Colletotrichum navitas]
MSNTLNKRLIIKLLWLGASVVFAFAFLHNLNSYPETRYWAEKKVQKFLGDHHGGSRESLRDFMSRSESIWAKTVAQRHEMIAADFGDASLMPLFPAVTIETYLATPYSVWDFIPASYNCPWDVERIGRMGDGGKWVCGMSRYVNYPKNRECIIYSFGVRDESSFEQEMLERTGCIIWAYDFSVVDFGEQLTPSNRDRAHFSQLGIAGKTDLTKTPPLYSIGDIMKKNGHEYIDILKMDIDSSEFEALDGMHREFPISWELPVGQLMIEVHLSEDMTSQEFLDWWERLEARGLRPAWTEPNLMAVTVSVGGKDPNMAEYTLVNVQDSRNILFHMQ